MSRTKRSLVVLGSLLALAGVFSVVTFAYAQGFTTKDTGATEAANSAGFITNLPCSDEPGGCLSAYAGTLIGALAGLFGVYFFGLILYGGFTYMSAGGEKDKTLKARQTIANAIIGMLIVASSYAIVSYVLNAISSVTTGASGV